MCHAQDSLDVAATSMNWRLRLQQWRNVLWRERGAGHPLPWLKMLRGILTPVPRAVWRSRLRYGCYQCPIFDKATLTCSSVHPKLAGLGCGCFVPFKALAPEPYEHGCWGQAKFGSTFGWPAYVFPSMLDRWLALPRFLFGR